MVLYITKINKLKIMMDKYAELFKMNLMKKNLEAFKASLQFNQQNLLQNMLCIKVGSMQN